MVQGSGFRVQMLWERFATAMSSFWPTPSMIVIAPLEKQRDAPPENGMPRPKAGCKHKHKQKPLPPGIPTLQLIRAPFSISTSGNQRRTTPDR